jgi:hypothetical protein
MRLRGPDDGVGRKIQQMQNKVIRVLGSET